MAIARKTSRASKAPKKSIAAASAAKPEEISTAISPRSISIFILFGFLFGYFLSKARATSYDAIVDMFMLKEFQLYGVLGVAILVVAAGLFLTHRFKKPTLSGAALDWKLLKFEPKRLIGALLFGAGWALAGATPATVLTQLGEGKVFAVFTVAGIFVGVWAFQKWKPKDSSGNNC
jgi:uncharacterized membrane protein YedE/YeeE